MANSYTNVSLLRRIGRDPRDANAWNEFVHIYGPRIDGWCRNWRLQEADVQDVTQTVLLRLSQHLQNFEYEEGRSFRGWLRTVTRNALSDFYRQRKKEPSPVADVIDTLEARTDLLTRLAEAFDLELLAEARDRVRQLVSIEHWRLFSLMADDGLPGAEAARQAGLSVANAFQIKSRISSMIKDEVQSLENEN